MEYFLSSSQQVVDSLAMDFAQEFPHLAESASLFYWSSSHKLVGRSLSTEPRPALTQTVPPSFFKRGEPLYVVKLFAGLAWAPSFLGLNYTPGQQTLCVETLTHLSRSGASNDDGAAFIMDENCLLVWCPAQGCFKDRLRGVVQRGLDRIQDDLSEFSRADADAAPSDVLGPIALDFNNGRSNAFDMNDFFGADGLHGINMMGASSSYGSPTSNISPSICITSPLMYECDIFLSSPPGFRHCSPANLLSDFSPPCVDPKLISPSTIPLEDVIEDTPSVSSSPLSSESSTGGDELSDVGTPYSPASPSPLHSPKREPIYANDKAASASSLSASRLLESPFAKSPRARAKHPSSPYRKAPASHKSAKKQRFICDCGKSYTRDKDRERHQEMSCDLMAVKPTVVCDVCHDVLGARPDALLRHRSSARCNPAKRSKAVA